MNAKLKSTGKRLAQSSFSKVIIFALLGNVIQTLAFYATKKLDDNGFALLNFGVYVIGLSSIFVDAFSKWLLLTVSSVKSEERFGLIKYALKNSTLPIYLIISTLILIIYIYSQPTPSESIVIGLSAVNILVGLIAIFPRAIIISQEKFVFSGTLDLIPAIARLIITALWLTSTNVPVLFIGLIVASLISLSVQYFYISRDKNWKNSAIIKKGDVLAKKFTFRGIIVNGVMQICIAAFFIADGVILKSLLSSQDYSTYVAYAYIYKFPLFATLSMMIVLLSKDFSDGNKQAIFRTLVTCLSVILLAFGVFMIFDVATGSWILNILGYSRYIVPGLTVIFGLSWLIHTSNYFIFAFLLKIKPHSRTVKSSILLYGILYIAGLFLLHYDVFSMLRGSLAVGVIFLGYNIYYVRFRRF